MDTGMPAFLLRSEQFGPRLKRALEVKGWDVPRLAEATGLAEIRLHSILTNDKFNDVPKEAEQLAAALEVDLAQLLPPGKGGTASAAQVTLEAFAAPARIPAAAAVAPTPAAPALPPIAVALHTLIEVKGGRSQREISRGAGVPQSTLSDLLSGKQTEIDLGHARKLADYFCVSVARVLGEREPPEGAARQADIAVGYEVRRAGLTMARLKDLRPHPLNPRKTFDQEGLEELAASIEQSGVLQNLVVREGEVPGTLWLIAGERRYRALMLLWERGKWNDTAANVPVKLLAVGDEDHLALALLENLQRREVNPMEEAEGFGRLHKLDPKRWSAQEIATRVGKSKRYVEQRLAIIARLTPEAQEALRNEQLTFTQARVLTMAAPEQQKKLLESAPQRTADQLHERITGGMVPASRAIFDLAPHGALLVENPENGARYFKDEAAFEELQQKAVQQRIKQLRKEWAWAETGAHFYADDYLPQPSEDRKRAGVFVELDYDGTVVEYPGLLKPSKRDTAAEDKRLEEVAAEREANEAAAEKFRAALFARLRKDPATALRLALFDRVARSSHWSPLEIFEHSHMAGLPRSFFGAKAPLATLRPFTTENDATANRVLQPAKRLEAFDAVDALPTSQVMEALAYDLAERLAIRANTADGKGYVPDVVARLARGWGIPVPACLQEGQADLEDAIAEEDAADGANAVRKPRRAKAEVA